MVRIRAATLTFFRSQHPKFWRFNCPAEAQALAVACMVFSVRQQAHFRLEVQRASSSKSSVRLDFQPQYFCLCLCLFDSFVFIFLIPWTVLWPLSFLCSVVFNFFLTRSPLTFGCALHDHDHCCSVSSGTSPAFSLFLFHPNHQLDCGIHPGKEGNDALPYLGTSLNNADSTSLDKVDAVLITHFHLDHCGALPFLLQKVGRLV